MQTTEVESNNTVVSKGEIKQASNNALASLLNLTFLPGVAFVYLILKYLKSDKLSIDHYHAVYGIKLNLIAFFTLLVVSALMILLGGFDSAWTWVYVITYFTFVHTVFILIAVWAMIRAWSGQKLTSKDGFNL